MNPATALNPTAAHAEADAGEWAGLMALRPRATVFSGPLVQLAHAAAFGPAPHLLAARRGPELVALWPMVVRPLKIGPLRLSELGFARNAHTLRNDLLLPADALGPLTTLFEACLALPAWQTLALDNIPDDPALAPLLPASARAAGLLADDPTPGRTLLHADPGPDFDAYLATRSGQFRRQLKKRDRELRALGPVGIERLSGPALIAALPEWQAVAAASWQGGTAEASALTAADWSLHHALASCGNLWLLRLSGRPIAALRMLEDAGAAYVHTMHFDRAFADHAPGTVLFAAMMQDACARRLGRVDFNGHSPFFARWATGLRSHLNWRLYRPGPAGHTARLARRGLELLRRRAPEQHQAEAPQ